MVLREYAVYIYVPQVYIVYIINECSLSYWS
jgi:hypothetical protein